MAIVTGKGGSGSRRPTHNYTVDEVIEFCRSRLDRVRVSLAFEGLGSIAEVCRQIERHASDPALAIVRVVPTTLGEPITSRRCYPVYERCEALGLPVSINVGFGAPGSPGSLQDPTTLDVVLIDFPDLVVVAAHGGHPWESLLVRLMRVYDNLYYSTSAVLAKYLDPAIVSFMRSSVGRSRVLFASDAPQLPLRRALDAARQLPLDDEAMELFLGENARRVLRLDDPSASDRGSAGSC